MGTTDRVIRATISVIFLILYITGMVTGTLGIVLLLVAGMFLLTSITAYCPMYALFGLSTIPGERKHRHVV
ncbi:YgaP family membrane protein [Pontibacter ruber]|nr:DUF2892 domain-containing protein [Pontibacter ruber]